MSWMLLVLFYGVMKGCREIVKKKSLGKNTALEVLLYYTLISFVMVLPDLPRVGGVTAPQYGYIALKSFVIFVAWICSFQAIDKLPISLFGVLDLSRVLFSTALGVFLLHETMSTMQIVGLCLVLTGLFLLKALSPKKKEAAIPAPAEKRKLGTAFFVFLAFVSCLLNAVSGTMDKVLMKDLTSSQLQFWYMLFLVIYYALYFLVTRTKLHWKSLVRNYWIYLLSIMFVLADRALFIANGMPESKVTIMTLIKQSGCIVTILGGRFIFHEKRIWTKLLCAVIIIAGIVVAIL